MSKDEPGSVGDIPVAKQALAQKRNVRDLNTRLEMFVRAQTEKSREVNTLKESLARSEMEYRNKLKQQKLQYHDQIEKSRKSIQNLEYDIKSAQQELENGIAGKKELEDRLMASESRNASISSENDTLSVEMQRLKTELDLVRTAFAGLKYKYESHELERHTFDDKIEKLKSKNDKLLRELTQVQSTYKSEKETFSRVCMEKIEEIEKLSTENKQLTLANSTTQTRLRKEFDTKLAEFVQKREEQYKQEKDEWMRIFKEEFNRKLRSFKEANQELKVANNKQLEENTELRERISKLKQQKMELEVQNRNVDEEMEKLRTDLDNLRRVKDEELKLKNGLLIQQRDAYKAKELQFDELAGIKMQLDSEIELYRSILNEAEQACGYVSPFEAKRGTNGGAHSRKRKRVHMTPTGHGSTLGNPFAAHNGNSDNTNSNSNALMAQTAGGGGDGGDGKKVETPGVGRAAKQAQSDIKSIKQALESDTEANEAEMKEAEELEEEEEDCQSVSGSLGTPGDLEGSALQFSGLDLIKGMIEIQNVGEQAMALKSHALSNKDGTQQFPLPSHITLDSHQKLRIYVGERYKAVINGAADDEQQEQERAKIVGSYDGHYVFWTKDVWTGESNDCARLYNSQQQQIQHIQISPDMVGSKNKACFIM